MGDEEMGRLSSFLENLKTGTKVVLVGKNGETVFAGFKEDVPHRFEDQVNVILGSVHVEGDSLVIVINYE